VKCQAVPGTSPQQGACAPAAPSAARRKRRVWYMALGILLWGMTAVASEACRLWASLGIRCGWTYSVTVPKYGPRQTCTPHAAFESTCASQNALEKSPFERVSLTPPQLIHVRRGPSYKSESRTVGNGLLRVEGAILASEALTDHLGILVDEHIRRSAHLCPAPSALCTSVVVLRSCPTCRVRHSDAERSSRISRHDGRPPARRPALSAPRLEPSCRASVRNDRSAVRALCDLHRAL